MSAHSSEMSVQVNPIWKQYMDATGFTRLTEQGIELKLDFKLTSLLFTSQHRALKLKRIYSI